MTTYSATRRARVLVVDDDPGPMSRLGEALSASGHLWSRIGRAGLAETLAGRKRCDVVLLDVGAHGRTALGVLPELRNVSDVPIIAMGDRNDGRDVCRALHMGADDYLAKPLRIVDMLVRIDVVLRSRRRAPTEPRVVRTGDVVIDLDARSVLHDGDHVDLTRTEFAILEVLGENQSRTVTRNAIMETVWGDASTSVSKSLDVHIAHLRAKLAHSEPIRTIRGHGYRMD